MAPDSETFEGQQIGPYKVGRQLAEHLGRQREVVYVAEDTDHAGALVICRFLIGLDPNQRASLGRLPAVHHRRLVSYERLQTAHVGAKRNVSVLVRPHLAVSLREYVYQRYVPEPTADMDQGFSPFLLLKDVCAGVVALHEQAVVHGDLRPSNVLLQGGTLRWLRWKVGDYGLRQVSPLKSLTSSEERLLAPEVTRAKANTEASDVYAFARLVRWVAARLGFPEGAETGRERLSWRWALERALAEDVTERPSMAEIYDMLFRKPKGSWSSQLERLPRRQLADAVEGEVERRASDDKTLERLPSPSPQALSTYRRKLTRQMHESSQSRHEMYGQADVTRLLGSAFLFTNMQDGHIIRKYKDKRKYMNSRDYLERFPEPDSEWAQRVRDEVATDFGLEYHENSRPSEVQFADGRSAEAELPWIHGEVKRQILAMGQIRREILETEDFLTATEMARQLSSAIPRLSVDEVRVFSRVGRLLAVRDHGALLFPEFQLRADRVGVYEAIETINHDLAESSDWGRLVWWCRPLRELGAAPKDLLSKLSPDDLHQVATNGQLAA